MCPVGRGLQAALLALSLAATGCGSQAPTDPATSAGAPGSSQAASAGPGSSAAATSPGGTTTLPPAGPALDPAAAAAAVLGAADDDARRAAVLGVLRGVNLGVYTPDGEQVLAGGERSMDDVWIYDFEVDGLAASVRDGDEILLADLASAFAGFAGGNGAMGVTPAAVIDHVTAAARSVEADPDQPRAYALAVAMELTQRGGSGTDLANPPADGPVVLDGLAAFLVELDIVLPLVEAGTPTARGRDLQVASLDGLGPATAQGCSSSNAGSGTPGWIAGVSAGRIDGLGGVSNASFDRYLQSRLVGALVEAKMTGPGDWHHGHTDANGTVTPEGTRTYTFSIRVRVNTPSDPVGCGSLQGSSVGAADGAIVGADVAWDYPGLELHASSIIGYAVTDAAGASTIEATPAVERYPSGIGPEQKKVIAVSAQVNVLRALGGDLYSRLAGVPAIQRRTVYSEVSWHRSYAVEVDIASELTITRGVTYDGTLGEATAEGTIPVIEFREGSTVPVYRGGEVINPGFLRTTTTPARTKGSCNTEWVLQKSGNREIDWQVRDLVISPEAELSLWMDTGANTNEQPDNYDGLLCAPGGRVRLGPSPGNVWETFIFLGYPQGIILDSRRGNGSWLVTGTDDTWARGGDLATWTSKERCNGRCKGVLIATVRIRPLPGP